MQVFRQSVAYTAARLSALTALILPMLLLGAAPPPAMAQTPPRYSITELAGIPQRLNNNGQIAGWIYVGADAHAAIYSHGAWRDLGVPAGDQLSALWGINSAGTAVGYAFAALPGPDNRWRAIWAPAGAATEVLSAPPPDSFAYAINDSGAIVGCLNRYDDIYPDPHRAFLYADGSMTDVHTLLVTDPNFDFSCARDINNAGIVVGEVQLASYPPRGFMYRDGAVSLLEQGTSYLTNARAVNEAGKVVGEGPWPSHAFVYDIATGAISSLGLEATGAYNSRPNDINNRGDVVGMMFLPVGEHAFLAAGGQVFDLNNLIPAGGDWVLQEAHSINDRGLIVGRGYRGSSPTVTRYFLLRPYGQVLAWGDNAYGQSSVPAGLTDVSAIAAGAYHSLALRSDGTVVGWGRDDFGQASVPAGLNAVTAISAGGFHNLALKSDGTVVAWGSDGNGRTDVPAGLSGVIAVSAGGGHSLALKSDGTVVAWGFNASGQVSVPAGLSGVTAIAAGGSHSLALKGDGTLVAWGEDLSGQSTVPAGLGGVAAVDAGGSHSLALKSDGTAVAWGFNSSEQATVPAGLQAVFALAAGGLHNLALVPPDTTAPVITPMVAGTLGNSGWYVSEVTVTWDVVDPESPISARSGCDPIILSTDTVGTTLTCSATSAGGTTSQSVTVKLDRTAPTVDAGPDVSLILGSPYTGGGAFSDSGPAAWTATADYGDGSGVQALALAGNAFTLGHVYATAGLYAVEVVVTDEAGNSGADTAGVTVLTPQQGAAALIEQVRGLVAQGILNGGQGNALIAKLEAAIRQLERGNIATAINQLEAFVNQVSALVGSGVLSSTEGQPLIDAANAILAVLGG